MHSSRRALFENTQFLESATFARIAREQRKANRVIAIISGVEPRQKSSMPLKDKVAVQKQLLEHMKELRRKAFSGPLVLKIVLHTADKNPTLSHNIAKNLLDLFARPLKELNTKRKYLLYKDDVQVQGLSVICNHGNDEPAIIIDARPMRDFLADLSIAREENAERFEDNEAADEAREALRDFNDVRNREQWYRANLGDEAFISMQRYLQQRAQRALFGEAAVSIYDLAALYGAGMPPLASAGLEAAVAQIFATTPLRITLSELPTEPGTSDRYVARVENELRAFMAKYGKVIDPILTPLALEVVVKPSAQSAPNSKHDLDNVVRRYILPRVAAIVKPISHPRFAIDMEAMQRHAPELAERMGAPPPASTKVGVTRYEAWRLPPAKPGEKGFVSIAVVADKLFGYDDVVRKLETAVDKWAGSLDDAF